IHDAKDSPMTRRFSRRCFWLAAVTPPVLGVVAFGQNLQIGCEEAFAFVGARYFAPFSPGQCESEYLHYLDFDLTSLRRRAHNNPGLPRIFPFSVWFLMVFLCGSSEVKAKSI